MYDINIDVHQAYLKERERDAANERANRINRDLARQALRAARNQLNRLSIHNQRMDDDTAR